MGRSREAASGTGAPRTEVDDRLTRGCHVGGILAGRAEGRGGGHQSHSRGCPAPWSRGGVGRGVWASAVEISDAGRERGSTRVFDRRADTRGGSGNGPDCTHESGNG